MNTSTINAEPLHSDELFLLVSSICLSIVEILSILCNSVILAIYYKYSRLRTATNLLIFNLALSHLLLATLEIALSLPSSFHRRWLYDSTGCLAYGFGFHYFISVEVCSLSVISFDRFCVITKPVRNQRIFLLTKTHVRLLILTIHVYSLLFAMPPLFGWNEYVPDREYHTGCYVDFADQRVASLTYTIVFVAFTCALPFVLTTTCYARIYRSVRDSSKGSTINNKSTQKISRTGESASRTNIHSRRRSQLTHTRTARMIMAVMVSFLLTWLPLNVAGLCMACGVHVPPVVVYVCLWIAKSCVMYNAVVYVFLNHRFRAAFLHLTFLCRDEHRLRLATSRSIANQSGRFGEIGDGIGADIYDRKSRGMAGKNLSKLSIISAGFNAEASSLSAGKVSVDLPTDASGGETSLGNKEVVIKRVCSKSRVNDALEGEESERRARLSTPTVPEEQTSSVEERTVGTNCASDSQDLSDNRGHSSVVQTSHGGYCQNSNIVLDDEGQSDDERFFELNVNSLGHGTGVR